MEGYLTGGERFVLVRTSIKPPRQVQATALSVRGALIEIEAMDGDFGAAEPARAVVLKGESKYIAAGGRGGGSGGENWGRLPPGAAGQKRPKGKTQEQRGGRRGGWMDGKDLAAHHLRLAGHEPPQAIAVRDAHGGHGYLP